MLVIFFKNAYGKVANHFEFWIECWLCVEAVIH